ncbi:hypothetical protein AVEN_1105-1 [Araneus ventricosus]|uniref:Uncharacterized protein n=1 Tax=Araneus ventricosus TaxID=182803 RepID=A0A4Y2P9N3_ARAVE|nr:hypothetical protein AVEN_1105-1 [Araneus ventricosus]
MNLNAITKKRTTSKRVSNFQYLYQILDPIGRKEGAQNSNSILSHTYSVEHLLYVSHCKAEHSRPFYPPPPKSVTRVKNLSELERVIGYPSLHLDCWGRRYVKEQAWTVCLTEEFVEGGDREPECWYSKDLRCVGLS